MDAIQRAIAVIRMRVDELGVAEPVIAPRVKTGSDRTARCAGCGTGIGDYRPDGPFEFCGP